MISLLLLTFLFLNFKDIDEIKNFLVIGIIIEGTIEEKKEKDHPDEL